MLGGRADLTWCTRTFGWCEEIINLLLGWNDGFSKDIFFLPAGFLASLWLPSSLRSLRHTFWCRFHRFVSKQDLAVGGLIKFWNCAWWIRFFIVGCTLQDGAADIFTLMSIDGRTCSTRAHQSKDHFYIFRVPSWLFTNLQETTFSIKQLWLAECEVGGSQVVLPTKQPTARAYLVGSPTGA